MNLLSIVVLSLSLSADSFAVAASKGAALRHPKPTEAFKTGAVFGIIQAIAPVIGWGLGVTASQFVSDVDHWIAFVILSALGIKMLWESFRACEIQEKPSRNRFRSLILAGIGTSIDAIGVGVSLAFVGVDIILTSAIIGLTTFVVASVGMMLGHMIGCKVGKWAEVIGGLVLMGLGFLILNDHMRFIDYTF